ncbi:MAG: glycosyltransferase [Clostridiales bacterium]|jgi:exopolysaccharide biosynthesis predicted pyruvyltransferase EpsI|nr:glycosyltransferase [Clostridiales bacterium]
MDITITVVTPTYNRAETLCRVYQSLKSQTFTSFEWIVADDGSFDDTEAVVASFANEAAFPVTYVFQPHSGKHIAVNNALSMAKGEFLAIADSDDSFKPESFSTLMSYWQDIPPKERERFRGVTCRCYDPVTNAPIGPSFNEPEDVLGIEATFVRKYNAEMWGVNRTDIMRRFPFPAIPGLKFFPETVIWNRMGREYKTRFINAPLHAYYKDRKNAITSRKNDRSKENMHLWLHYLNETFDYLPKSPKIFLKAHIGVFMDAFITRTPSKDIFKLIRRPFNRILAAALSPIGAMIFLRKELPEAYKRVRARISLSGLTLFRFLNPGKITLLLNTHAYGNLGDHAISLGARAFLKGHAFFEMTGADFSRVKDIIAPRVKPDDVILISGGGHMGDLWMEEESNIRDILALFTENKVVILPQSVYFSGDHAKNPDYKLSRAIYGSHKNLTIYARDAASQMTLSNMAARVKLSPDMSLCLKYPFKSGTRTGVLTCFRSDEEKVLSDADRERAETFLRDHFGRVKKMAAVLPLRLGKISRAAALFIRLRSFARAGLIVTDRLHAVLFAAITGSPCVAFDNSTRKISGAFLWLKGREHIQFVKNVEEMETAARRAINADPSRATYNISELFDELRREIYG